MSESKKNFNEVRGAWIGFIGSIGAIIFALVFIIGGPMFYIRYPGTMNDILIMMNQFALQAVSANLQRANAVSWYVLVPAIISVIFSLVRRKAGVSRNYRDGKTLYPERNGKFQR